MATPDAVRKMLADPTDLLDSLGSTAVSWSQKNFTRQSFGATGPKWDERYPFQSAPKINIAGALRDFGKGLGAPQPKRFEDRPAAIDDHYLRRSIAHRILSPGAGAEGVVEVGTELEYASVQQDGGPSEQEVTQGARDRIARYIDTAAGRPYADKLRPLIAEEVHITDVIGRRFIGVSKELEDLLAMQVEIFIEHAEAK